MDGKEYFDGDIASLVVMQDVFCVDIDKVMDVCSDAQRARMFLSHAGFHYFYFAHSMSEQWTREFAYMGRAYLFIVSHENDEFDMDVRWSTDGRWSAKGRDFVGMITDFVSSVLVERGGNEADGPEQEP